jgi:aminoglycoside 2'-N-acetyltransferase I
MSITISLKRLDDFSDEDRESLGELKDAVYPPEREGEWEGASRGWSRPEWGVFVRNDAGDLVSYTGVIRREGAVDGRHTTIGGVGDIATHPDHRGMGYAPLGMGRALDYLATRDTDFALLVCRDQLVSYYQGLGWRLFEGEVRDTQFGEPDVFELNRVMVGDLNRKAPLRGTIDLRGPAW